MPPPVLLDDLATRQQIRRYLLITFVLSAIKKKYTAKDVDLNRLSRDMKEDRSHAGCDNRPMFGAMRYLCTLAVRGRQSAAMMTTVDREGSGQDAEFVLALEDSNVRHCQTPGLTSDPQSPPQHAAQPEYNANVIRIPERTCPDNLKDFYIMLVAAIRPETQLSTAAYVGQLRAFLGKFSKRIGHPPDKPLLARWTAYVIFSCLDNIRARLHRDHYAHVEFSTVGRAIWEFLTIPLHPIPGLRYKDPVLESKKPLSRRQRNFFKQFDHGDLDSRELFSDEPFYTRHTWIRFHMVLRTVLLSCDKDLENLDKVRAELSKPVKDISSEDMQSLKAALGAALESYDRVWAFERRFQNFIRLHLKNLETFFRLRHKHWKNRVYLDGSIDHPDGKPHPYSPADEQDEVMELQNLWFTHG